MKKNKKIVKLAKRIQKLKKLCGEEYFIEIKEAQKLLGYKSYPSFYSHIILPAVKYGLIEKPFRGVIKIKGGENA